MSGARRYIFATLLFAAVLFAVIFGVFHIDNSTNSMIVEYAENLGWEINPSPAQISHFVIPENFDAVFETYNALQKSSGFDLSEFKGKRVSRYTYVVKNHIQSANSQVFLGIIVFESRIIAGEISSTDSDGFMHGITETSNIRE
ncbi:MAG: DUF4830 domain-containing protein [Clostridia bacterium]|nr:DUF4830 domain-containing protein [Clostridia bacterium]